MTSRRAMTLSWFALPLLLASVATAQAETASWYRWRSLVDGRVTCAQTSPGHGWERLRGAYDNPRCAR